MLSRFCLALILTTTLLTATACQSAEVVPEPTPIQWQRVTFVASRLLPGFAINIPADWNYLVSDSGIIIYNYPRLLDLADDGAEIPSGSIVANLSMLSAADVQRIGARNAADILDSFIGSSSDTDAGPQYSDAEVFAIGGREIAQSLVTIDANDSLLMAMSLEGNYLLAVIVAPRGEMSQQGELLNQIFSTTELRLSG